MPYQSQEQDEQHEHERNPEGILRRITNVQKREDKRCDEEEKLWGQEIHSTFPLVANTLSAYD